MTPFSMRTHRRLLAGLAGYASTVGSLVACAMGGSAAMAQDQWEYAWPLENATAPAGFVRVDLTPEFVDRAAPTLADARLIPETRANTPWDDAQAAQVPYMLHFARSEDAHKQEWKPLQVLNRVFEPDRFEQLVLDYGEPRPKNQLKITLSGENFRRRVTIEGSNDGQSWKTVREDGWLFDISEPHGNYEVNIVEFPLNDFRYVRLTVHHMADDPRRIEIEDVLALHEETNPVEVFPVPIGTREDRNDDLQRITEIFLDLHYRNLPVSRIQFTTGALYFYRAVEVFGRNAETERIKHRTETGWDETEREVPWYPVARGVIYRTQESDPRHENLAINGSIPYRHVRIVIYNQDNPPLAMDAVQVFRRPLPALIFDNDPATPLVLLSGNELAAPPQFDLARSVPELDIDALPRVTIQTAPLDRDIRAQTPWTSRNTWIIWLALVPAVLVMAGLIYANLAKMKHETRD